MFRVFPRVTANGFGLCAGGELEFRQLKFSTKAQ